jgi:signal transduction histidine kinase
MLADGEAGEVTPQAAKMLETIDRSSVRLRNLIEDLLTLSKLETGATATVLRPISLAQAITEAAEAVQPSADGGGLHLSITAPPPGLLIDADAAQIDRVLLNLLSNAVKYTPPGGAVHLAAATDGPDAVITITDTGIGIPERDQKELFTRFYRASNATARRIPGTGLGLAIVATIIANHHGAIDLTSTEGTGTTVTVRLPLPQPGEEAAHAPDQRPRSNPILGPRLAAWRPSEVPH